MDIRTYVGGILAIAFGIVFWNQSQITTQIELNNSKLEKKISANTHAHEVLVVKLDRLLKTDLPDRVISLEREAAQYKTTFKDRLTDLMSFGPRLTGLETQLGTVDQERLHYVNNVKNLIIRMKDHPDQLEQLKENMRELQGRISTISRESSRRRRSASTWRQPDNTTKNSNGESGK